MKQTAVRWLQEQLNPDMKTMQGNIIQDLLEQALAMEKEQHQVSFNKGYDRRNYIHDFEYGGVEYWEEEPKEFEEYYNETYGGNK